MRKHTLGVFILMVMLGTASVASAAEQAPEFKKQQRALFNDVFNQNLYHEFVNQLDFGRWWRRLAGKKVRSKNVNLYDEVPDSIFFTNRHAKKAMSLSEIQAGSKETDGPKLPFVITKGKSEGLHPGYFVEDAKGDAYLIKFDSTGNVELVTSAEVITGRFYHALGYNVPQYTIATFTLDDLKLKEGASYRDDSGFKKTLTLEKVHEQMMFVPRDRNGRYRGSASLMLDGENKGSFSFRSRRKNDPEDLIQHRDRREIRALTVFSAWLNNNDIRESNTLDMLVEENGRQVLKHYLFDFNSSLGGAHEGPKPPMFGYEYMMDFGEATKAFLSLGLWEKPWQEKWRLAGEKVEGAPAVGYFNADEFDPPSFKTQLPYDAFRMLTLADGFWAAKQIAAFSDEDIRAAVAAGELSRGEDEAAIAQALIERRDSIVRYWFTEANALDRFDVQNDRLMFIDRAIQQGVYVSSKRRYHAELFISGKKTQEVVLTEPALVANFSGEGKVVLRVETQGREELSPFVEVRFSAGKILSIIRED